MGGGEKKYVYKISFMACLTDYPSAVQESSLNINKVKEQCCGGHCSPDILHSLSGPLRLEGQVEESIITGPSHNMRLKVFQVRKDMFTAVHRSLIKSALT